MLKVNKENAKKKELEILKDNIYATILIIFIIIIVLWYLIYVFDFNNSLLYNDYWNNDYWNEKQNMLFLLNSKYDSRKFVPDNLLVYDKHLFYNSLFYSSIEEEDVNNKMQVGIVFHENKSLFLEYGFNITIDHKDHYSYINSHGNRRIHSSSLCVKYPWWNYKMDVYCCVYNKA